MIVDTDRDADDGEEAEGGRKQCSSVRDRKLLAKGSLRWDPENLAPW